MPAGHNCEACGAAPPNTGKFSTWGYCAHCSKDLCDACMRNKRCREASDRKHAEETDCCACVGGRVQDGATSRKCLDCNGTGTVLKGG